MFFWNSLAFSMRTYQRVHHKESINELGNNSVLTFWRSYAEKVCVFWTCLQTTSPTPLLKCISHEIIRRLLLGRKAMRNLDSVLKSRDITLSTKVCIVKDMFFSSSHVQMWELDHKEGWASKNWCFQTVALEKTLESPFECKEIKPVNPKGNQSWIFIGGTDSEAEAAVFWPSDAKSQLVGKDPDAGKDWRQEEKRMTEWNG